MVLVSHASQILGVEIMCVTLASFTNRTNSSGDRLLTFLPSRTTTVAPTVRPARIVAIDGSNKFPEDRSRREEGITERRVEKFGRKLFRVAWAE